MLCRTLSRRGAAYWWWEAGAGVEDRLICKCPGHCTFHLRFLSSSLYCSQSNISPTLLATARGGSFSQGFSLTLTQGPS